MKSITVLLYDFVFDFLCKISTFTFAINNATMNSGVSLKSSCFTKSLCHKF